MKLLFFDLKKIGVKKEITVYKQLKNKIMKTIEELTKSVYCCKNEKNTTVSEHLHNIELVKEEINNYMYIEWLDTQRNIQQALELLEKLKKEEIAFM